MNRGKYKLTVFYLVFLLTVTAFLFVAVKGAEENTVYLADGGSGDGSTSETPLGDMKEAVRLLAKTGGRIVICGKYTFTELISLSEKSGTSNGDNTITVTSLHNGVDHRLRNDAALCVGDSKQSANMILAGRFVFEELNIVTNGSDKGRYIICGGYDTVFGEGIVCKKLGDAPFISIAGISLDDGVSGSCTLTIKSGSYYNVFAGTKNGGNNGDTWLNIEGGVFEGSVSANGAENGKTQKGSAFLDISGGSFYGSVGALSPLSEFVMTVNGGSFRKDIKALGKYNTVEINGGSLQSVNSIIFADYIPPVPETNDNGETAETKESDVKITSFTVNSYSGDVKKLAEKVKGEGVVVNINTLGGSDVETTALQTDGIIPSPETNGQPDGGQGETSPIESVQLHEERSFLLGTKEKTVFAIIAIAVIMALSVVMLAYRSVYRKK